MAIRRSKAMATATEAKVADTAAEAAMPSASLENSVTEAMVADAPAPVAETGEAVAAAIPALPEVPAEAVAVLAAPSTGPTHLAAPPQTRITMESTMTQVTKATEGFMKAAEEAAEFSRGNLEAMSKATQLYVAGVQDLGKQTMALVQGLADHNVAGAKALGAVKSLKEAAEIQATYTRAALEKSFSETAKLQEAAMKLAETSFAPISARMTLAVEKFAKPIAA